MYQCRHVRLIVTKLSCTTTTVKTVMTIKHTRSGKRNCIVLFLLHQNLWLAVNSNSGNRKIKHHHKNSSISNNDIISSKNKNGGRRRKTSATTSSQMSVVHPAVRPHRSERHIGDVLDRERPGDVQGVNEQRWHRRGSC